MLCFIGRTVPLKIFIISLVFSLDLIRYWNMFGRTTLRWLPHFEYPPNFQISDCFQLSPGGLWARKNSLQRRTLCFWAPGISEKFDVEFAFPHFFEDSLRFRSPSDLNLSGPVSLSFSCHQSCSLANSSGFSQYGPSPLCAWIHYGLFGTQALQKFKMVCKLID